MKETDNWYTPPEVLDLVKMFYSRVGSATNELYFDPCPVNPDFNGLEVDWAKDCFINPPYSNALKTRFVKKGFSEYAKTDNTGNYVWLFNYGCSLREVMKKSSAICLPYKRIKFIPGHESLRASSPRYDNVFIYWGKNVTDFAKVFNRLGIIYQPKFN